MENSNPSCEHLPRVGAVILAAGKPQFSASKTDTPPKMGSITALQRMVRTLQRVEADPIVIVTGYQANIIQKQTSSLRVIYIHNENWEHSDMLASAKLGLSYIKDICDLVFFTPADIPLFTADTAAALLSVDADASIPVKNKKKGHPLLLRTSLIPGILAYEGDGGITKALHEMHVTRCMVPVEDDGILFNTKYHTDWQPLVLKHNTQPLYMDIGITLSQEVPFFDPVCASFLRLIERTQSVREACRQLNISYSKGWNMLNTMEQQLHFPVVVRNPGGTGGGSTYLSAKGKHFLEQYEQLLHDITTYSKEAYKRIFQSESEGF